MLFLFEVTRVLIGNLTELILPLLRNRRTYKKESKLVGEQCFIRVEEEFMLTQVSVKFK